MKQDIKDQWVNALESDEYTQGFGELRTTAFGYCCLGVLCDLAVKAGVAQWAELGPSGWAVIPIGKTLQDTDNSGLGTSIVPEFLREWSGLESGNPWIKFGDELLSLGHINDNKNKTFPEIAEIIREQL